MLQLFLLLLILLFIGFIVAVKFLPWWGILILIAGIVLLARYGGKWLVKQLFMLPFRMKGAVLKGASIQIHSIRPAEPPAKREPRIEQSEDGDHADDVDQEAFKEEDKTPRRYYSLDVTITPKPPTGKFQLWEPTELLLVDPSVANDIESDQDHCVISKFELEDDGQFTDAFEKYDGPRRLRLLLGVKEGVRELRFRYYFEPFGNVTIP